MYGKGVKQVTTKNFGKRKNEWPERVAGNVVVVYKERIVPEAFFVVRYTKDIMYLPGDLTQEIEWVNKPLESNT